MGALLSKVGDYMSNLKLVGVLPSIDCRPLKTRPKIRHRKNNYVHHLLNCNHIHLSTRACLLVSDRLVSLRIDYNNGCKSDIVPVYFVKAETSMLAS